MKKIIKETIMKMWQDGAAMKTIKIGLLLGVTVAIVVRVLQVYGVLPGSSAIRWLQIPFLN